MHALIIEDNPLITASISDQLKDCGFTSIDCAETCGEAISSAVKNCPDLITADHWLAGESSISTIRRIRENRPIPVIYIVALPNEVRAEEPYAFILQKPFNTAQLERAVEEVLRTFVPQISNVSASCPITTRR